MATKYQCRRHIRRARPFYKAVPSPADLNRTLAHALLCALQMKGYPDSVGAAGYNAINGDIQRFINELGQVERLGLMPLPAIHGIKALCHSLSPSRPLHARHRPFVAYDR
ncbi:uncharacterized protein L969DRAFT_83847 [Mixia osmundae IAM 14324]|uniref:uncharacterized protein n=1 Tax=Mixia osmundae (strain CBS 9802 / IAM 14324 / JCM 22182 / KY 12970) TaxID=764103 RepID=UPI0004A558C1|nr:uncharacterized protein L969DRAFT_83847 [Mixia osmundae IAM 14324]KEI41993.1 hypothetical protein L969DRAFT_83847 [Mixia osmundae IAM 14324]